MLCAHTGSASSSAGTSRRRSDADDARPRLRARARSRDLDLALWKSLERFPSVTALSGFTVTDVVRDEANGRVRGVVGKDAAGETRELRARWIVGADGRFSLVARKVGARVEEDHAEKVSTVYQSVWEDVLPFEREGDGLASLFTTGRGQNILFFSAPERRTMVIAHMRADRVEVKGDAEAYYHGVSRSTRPYSVASRKRAAWRPSSE